MTEPFLQNRGLDSHLQKHILKRHKVLRSFVNPKLINFCCVFLQRQALQCNTSPENSSNILIIFKEYIRQSRL